MASRHPVTIGSLKVPYPIKADNLQVFLLCSATHAASPNILDEGFGGAGDGTRTRNVLFGKQKLYH